MALKAFLNISCIILFTQVSFALTPEMSGIDVAPEPNLAPEWRHEFNPLVRHLSDKQDKSYVFLISFAPEKTVSFKNGRSLKNSMIALRRDEAGSVGHTMVGWHCSNGRELVSRGLTAFSGERSTQVKKLRDRGFGLLGALAVYTDGYLQNGQTSVLNYKFSQVQKGIFQMKWIGVRVSDQACRRVESFKNRFRSSGASRNFGFNLNPATLEGAGCSSYARHVLNEAGVLNSSGRHWTRSLSVPYTLIANPDRGSIPGNDLAGVMPRNMRFRFDLNSLQKEPVTTADLALKSWEFDRPGIPLDITDTELIYYTILQAEIMVKQGRRQSFPSSIRTRFRRVRQTDRGGSENAQIDRNLDDNTSAIYTSLRANRLDTLDYSHSMINGVTGLILEGDLK